MKNETIVDRVVERIKLQPLGDLITEEDLHDIVKEALPKAFFQNVTTTEGTGYHPRVVTTDPLIVVAMREVLKEQANKIVHEYMKENEEKLMEYWKQVMDDNLLNYVNKIQDARATADVRSALNTLLVTINEERMRNGLATIMLY